MDSRCAFPEGRVNTHVAERVRLSLHHGLSGDYPLNPYAEEGRTDSFAGASMDVWSGFSRPVMGACQDILC